MSTVDFRTRHEGDETDLDPATFIDDLAAELVEANGPVALLGADRLGLPSLTLDEAAFAERRVVYTGFGLAARPGDRVSRPDAETTRRDRAALNDHVRRRQNDRTGPSTRTASFDL